MYLTKAREYWVFIRNCLALASGERLLFISTIGVSLISSLLEGVGASLIAPLLESVSDKPVFAGVPILGAFAGAFAANTVADKVRLVAIIMLIVVLLRGAAQYASAVLSAIVPLRLQRTLAQKTFNTLMNINIAYIDNKQGGDISGVAFNSPVRAAELIKGFFDLLSSFISLGIYFVLMLAISWQMAFIAISVMGILSLINRALISRPLRKAGQDAENAAKSLLQVVYETLGGMKLIRLCGAETLIEQRYNNALENTQRVQRHLISIQQGISPFFSTFSGVFIAALLFLATTMAKNDSSGDMIGMIMMFLFLLFRILGPVTMINNARAAIQVNLYSLDTLERFLEDGKRLRQPNGQTPFVRLTRKLTIEGLTFTYGPDQRPVLDQVSFELLKGKMVAVVGPSGAGKTTLINLLTRFEDPQAGRIVIDGVDLRDLNVQSWRQRISVVSQDIVLFNDSVTNNIAFGLPETSVEKVKEASRLASADEFIAKLPNGYDTSLGDRGVRLSGGQRQRIAIARAILRDPDLLILDEATSHLDSITERAIQRAVEMLSQDRTLLVIAHRLSTIRRADTIIVLNEGRVVEQGSHQELLARRGQYWDMIEHQRLDLVNDDTGELNE